ncbi:hypothetical protein HYV86_06650 [Candidatus Woesearchaeota archaeon]|nr:hypothetical protein [Candidatus Woesearchaeota archaeon]
MPTLIACLSTGKGTWTEVIKLIGNGGWSKIFLITNQFGKDNFKTPTGVEMIVISEGMSVEQMTATIVTSLRGKISDFEVALNFVSGTGVEHMALLEAVLELGLNFRLVVARDRGIGTLGIERS